MAILRASEIREKDDAELEADLNELRKTLMKIRGGVASGGIPEDVGKLREIKKTIARIMTIRHERKLGLKKEQKPKPILKEKEDKEAKPEEAKPEETKGDRKKDKKMLQKEAPKKTIKKPRTKKKLEEVIKKK